MDFILDIIILKNEIKKIRLNERLIEWGGQSLSCEPLQYIAMENILFEQVSNSKYYNEIVEDILDDSAIILSLKSDLISDLEYEINNKNSVSENELVIFLMSLFELSMFYVLLIREDEKPKEKFEIQEHKQIANKICESLNWENPKDVVLFKKEF